MIIITNNKDNVIVCIANNKIIENSVEIDNLDKWDNGYPVVKSKNMAFISETVNVYENISVENLSNIEEFKYCYTPKEGFYLNPNWIDPEEAIILTPEYQAGYDQAVLDMINDGIL